ncbi:type II secretion system F family protein [Ornithinimicrobium sp. Y1847]|uniref:type II secretion system F family protein n=1 Tax=unclassified Ornithinimicrobium TaxID=2615080 RepID=UPI003B67FCD2
MSSDVDGLGVARRGRSSDTPGDRADDAAPGQADPLTQVLAKAWERIQSLMGEKEETDPWEVHLLDALAAGLEAGLPTDRALRVALESSIGADEDLRPAWSDLLRAVDLGQPLGPAWARLARRERSSTLAALARAWAVASASGAPLASAVRAGAASARERHRVLRSVQVAVAGARASAMVLTLLPVAGVGLAAVLGIMPTELYSTPIALASAGFGLFLLAGGYLVVDRMVAAVRRRAA